jgi:hypothetical protein
MSLFSQKIDSDYCYEDTLGNYINFQNDSILFKIQGYGFIVRANYGIGTYKIKKDRTVFYPISYPMKNISKSYYREKDTILNDNHVFQIYLKDKDNLEKIPYANVYIGNRKEIFIGGQTDKGGRPGVEAKGNYNCSPANIEFISNGEFEQSAVRDWVALGSNPNKDGSSSNVSK